MVQEETLEAWRGSRALYWSTGDFIVTEDVPGVLVRSLRVLEELKWFSKKFKEAVYCVVSPCRLIQNE